MESVGTHAGALVAPAAFSADYPGKMMPDTPVATTTPSRKSHASIDPQSSAWLDTPAAVPLTNHFEASNVRGSTDHAMDSRLPAGHGRETEPSHEDALPNNSTWSYSEAVTPLNSTPYRDALAALPSDPKTPSNSTSVAVDKSSTAMEAVEAEQLTRAYAMVKFRDSHCYITTPNLVIVRDINFLQDWQAQEKERKRRVKAHAALQQYALEPSQPSQPGDDDRQDPSSRSGESLVGRPERGLLSHYSEQGGPVAYALSDDEEEMRSTQRKRRLLRTLQNSSSANSIAPHNLHPNEGSEFLQTGQHFDSEGHPSDPLEWAQLPVHPPRPDDIKKISREHLIFTYNSDYERWELKVIGNRAFVNGTLYDKHDVVPLSHNDEIIIASLTMNFMLPDDLVREVDSETARDEVIESVEAGSRASLTPDRRLSDVSGDSDDDEDEGEPTRGRLKIKLSLKKARPKDGAKSGGGKGKGKSKHDQSTPPTVSESPETAKKAAKTRKPSDTAEAIKQESNAASPPALPLNLDPNSTLAGLAPDELPEKRKGPGRPPKNGLVSKRDEAIIRKKIKEREKKGLPIPEYRILLEETRNENRQRDLANKAQARGEPMPDIPLPSVENGRTADSAQPTSQPPAEGTIHASGSPAAIPERKPSPKPRRVVRSPSPMKPMSAFTEEELKKPNMTYIYIIDEILQNVDGGQADLQTIYDKIQKRWPYYRYKVTSSGWQSSVRHNLLSCPRFVDAGKSGKGKFWTINHEYQLDKQKRKPSPPPPRPLPHAMPNGQYPSNGPGMPAQWYGQAQYNGPYGPQTPNGTMQAPAVPPSGNGAYYSPYAPSQTVAPGNHPPIAHGHPGPMPQMRQPLNGPYPRPGSHTPHPPQHNGAHSRPPGQPAQPQSQSHATPFQPVVDAIMNYRTEYLGRCLPDSDEYRQHEDRFKKGTQYFSNLFHNQANDEMSGEDLGKEPFNRIEQIFERFRPLFSNSQQNNPTVPAPGAHGVPPTAPSQANGAHDDKNKQNDKVANGIGGHVTTPMPPANMSHPTMGSQQTVGGAQEGARPTPTPVNQTDSASATASTVVSMDPAIPVPASSNVASAPPAPSVTHPPQSTAPSHPIATTPIVPTSHHPISSAPPTNMAVASGQPFSVPVPPATSADTQFPSVPPTTGSPPENSHSIAQTDSTPGAPAGNKRSADELGDDPDAKRVKTEPITLNGTNP